jgi:hypothetical protein
LPDQEKLKVFQAPKRAAEILLGREKFSKDIIGLISTCHERPLKKGISRLH